MQNREELRQKGHDGSWKTTFWERGKNIIFRGGGGNTVNIIFGPKYRPLIESFYHYLPYMFRQWTAMFRLCTVLFYLGMFIVWPWMYRSCTGSWTCTSPRASSTSRGTASPSTTWTAGKRPRCDSRVETDMSAKYFFLRSPWTQKFALTFSWGSKLSQSSTGMFLTKVAFGLDLSCCLRAVTLDGYLPLAVLAGLSLTIGCYLSLFLRTLL